MSATPIQAGESCRVRNHSGEELVECTHVTQRNWSRVGSGILHLAGQSKHQKVFLKQNMGSTGTLHQRHWHYEQLGTAVGTEVLQSIVDIPRLLFHDETLALNVFEHRDVLTIDEQLRKDERQFQIRIPKVMPILIAILEAMKSPPNSSLIGQLPVKIRDYGSDSNAIGFKGFDIRNIGFEQSSSVKDNTLKLVMFDFGRPYRAPIEESAAKLLVSIGLLNWGKPVSRFAQGPDQELWQLAHTALAPFLDPQAIRAEIALQAKFRCEEVHGSSWLERSLKTFGTQALGKRYLSKLSRFTQ